MKFQILIAAILLATGFVLFHRFSPRSEREMEHYYALGPDAIKAFDARDFATAKSEAKELKLEAANFKDDWNYGNAIQDSNIVFGRLALRDGRLEEAKKYLLAAGNSPGSPQMDSFGPNFSLANDLLAKGEKGTVLTYLNQCKKFWADDYGALGRWIIEINAGKKPNFGSSFVHSSKP